MNKKRKIDENKVKKNCFFFDEDEYFANNNTSTDNCCNALIELMCGCEECRFYKSEKEEIEARVKYGYDLYGYSRNYKAKNDK